MPLTEPRNIAESGDFQGETTRKGLGGAERGFVHDAGKHTALLLAAAGSKLTVTR